MQLEVENNILYIRMVELNLKEELQVMLLTV